MTNSSLGCHSTDPGSEDATSHLQRSSIITRHRDVILTSPLFDPFGAKNVQDQGRFVQGKKELCRKSREISPKQHLFDLLLRIVQKKSVALQRSPPSTPAVHHKSPRNFSEIPGFCVVEMSVDRVDLKITWLSFWLSVVTWQRLPHSYYPLLFQTVFSCRPGPQRLDIGCQWDVGVRYVNVTCTALPQMMSAVKIYIKSYMSL